MKSFSLFVVCVTLAAAPAVAQTRHQAGSLAAPEPDMPAGETLGYLPDAAHRMTLDVSVAGRGPYRFVVDTGAERTVVSSQLAQELGLDSGGDITLASIASVTRVPSVVLSGLEVGRRTIPTIRAPSLDGGNIGAQGMLGVDSLRSQRVVFDFRQQQLSLSDSHLEDQSWPADTIVVTGRTRLGRLVLADALIDGQRIRAIVDTGSQVTIANFALRNQLQRRGRLGATQILELRGVAGDIIRAEYTRARRIRIGDVNVDDLPIAFADVELFNQLGLANRPAILLGMDVLRMFDRVSIDFANRRVRLLLPRSSIAPAAQLAAINASQTRGRVGSRF